jgi:hypothetical protein
LVRVVFGTSGGALVPAVVVGLAASALSVDPVDAVGVAATVLVALDIVGAVVALLELRDDPPQAAIKRLVAMTTSDGRSLIAPSIVRPPSPSCIG